MSSSFRVVVLGPEAHDDHGASISMGPYLGMIKGSIELILILGNDFLLSCMSRRINA